jgi:transposase
MQTLPAPGGEQEELLKKYVVHLTADERAELEALTRKGSGKARRLKHALVLLAADDGETDAEIASKLRVHANTVHQVRRRFVEEGLDPALSERPRPGKTPLLNGHQEAHLIALACSNPPEGRVQWTMQLLANKLVELCVVPSISDETVRRVLKRGKSSPGFTASGASRA